MDKVTLISIPVIVIIALVYILVPFYQFSGESMYVASRLEVAVKDGQPLALFNTHKPFYQLLMYAVYKGILFIAPEASAMSAVRGFNLIIGLATLILFFLLIRTSASHPSMAVFATIFLAFAYVFWYSSKEAGGNILVLFLTVVFLFFLFKLHTNVPSPVFHLIIGVILGLMALLDITAILLIIPAFFYNPYGKDYQLGLKFVTLAVAILMLCIGLGIIYSAFGFDDIENYGNMLIKGLEAGYYSGRQGPVFELTPDAAFKSLVFTGEGLIGGEGTGSVIFRILAGLLFVGVLIIAVVKWEHFETRDKTLVVFSFAWFIPMVIFYALWHSSAMQSSLLWVPALAIIFATTIFAGQWVNLNRFAVTLGIIMLALLLASNLMTVVIPNANPDSNPSLKLSKWFEDNLTKEDLVVFFETKEESANDPLFWYYLPFEARRASFTIDWRPASRTPKESVEPVMKRFLGKGSKVVLLIKENVEGGMMPLDFLKSFPGYEINPCGREGNISLYEVIR